MWLCVSDNVHILFLHQMRISSLRKNFFYISKLQKVKFGKSLRKICVLCGCKKWCTRCKIRLSLLCGIIISKCVTHRNGHTIKRISCTPNFLEYTFHLWWFRKVSLCGNLLNISITLLFPNLKCNNISN